jgi:hypothetical protein
MKKIVSYVRDYFVSVDSRALLAGSLFIALAIFINYHYGLNQVIVSLPDEQQFLSWYLVFITAFSLGYVFFAATQQKNIFNNNRFLILLIIAPAIFAWKMVFEIDLFLSANQELNEYWNQVIYWPLKLVVVTALLFLTWKISKEQQPFYGLTNKAFRIKPYILMLVVMLPLIAIASTQPDFLNTYPKLKNISFLNDSSNNGFYKLLYELSYGSDFFTIELFFRGFLVLAFSKWFGKNAILPMAMFYCTIHFGKPLGECISSFLGGIVLGVVTYHTRTIFGGLMVHLGIAWLMELGGHLGNKFL